MGDSSEVPEVFFVVDEVGSSHGSEEDEPEVVFVKETSFVCETASESNSNCENPAKNAQSEDDEPEVIFSTEVPFVICDNLSQESVTVLSDDENKKSPTSPVSVPTSNTAEVEPKVTFLEDVAGLFCLDTTPEVAKEKKPLGPRFHREFSSTLKSEEDSVESPDGAKSDNRCFNCQGDHSLANCPHPKNQQEISKNRSAFMKNQPKLMNRYHVDKPQKYDSFKPGVISKELRTALGLRSSDIPLHIYQMRILGYPPGWIEEIKEYSSGLEFIDSAASSSIAEGSQTISFDYDRIIDYPGFNVPVESRVRDDWRYLNFPPMQMYHSKEIFIENLKMYNKRQIGSTETGSNHFNGAKEEFSDGTIVDLVDMDVDLDTSIEDLEFQRQALLAQLDEDDSPPGDGDSNLEKSESQDPPSESNVEKPVEETISIEAEKPSVQEEVNSNSTEQNMSPKRSKLLAMGTPVSIRFSPYNALPARDKFAQNMGELELFENLPTSTGAFQKMRSLLQKVRKVFKKK